MTEAAMLVLLRYFLLGNWKAFFKAMKPTVIQRLLANE